MLEFLHYPFMWRALLAGGFVAILLGWLGAFIITRRMSFIGDGVAHASLAGIAIAILLGWTPIPTAIIFAIFIGIGIYLLEKKTSISGDAAIAIIFTTFMAIGVILLHFYQGYQPELISYLFGNILTINNTDLLSIIIIGLLILSSLFIFHRQILFTTFDSVGAYLSGLNTTFYDLLLYITTSVAIVLSIKLVGIVLVSALLVTPGVTARLFARSFKQFIFFTIIFSFITVILGLIASYYLDWPSGATIIITTTVVLFLSFLVKKIISLNVHQQH
jgi:zinc transport system permease protein